MAEYANEFLAVAAIHILGAMSPGPDFVLVSRNAVVHSRRAGVYSALGIAAGIGFHVAYSLAGVALLISQSIIAFNVLKYAGAAYLIWIGIRGLRAQPASAASTAEHERFRPAPSSELSARKAFHMGLLTNILNPKVTMFFLAIFTQVISPQTPTLIQFAYGIEMIIATASWFSLVAVALSAGRIRTRFEHIKHWIDRTFGAALVFLGGRIALSSR